MHDSFPGASVGYEPVSLFVDPPVLPTAVIDHALAASRKKSLLTNTDRDLLLVACAVEVERYVGRVFWPGEPAARSSTSVVIVRDSRLAVPYCPLYPDVSGVTLAVTLVRRWDDDAQDWITLTLGVGYLLCPGGRIIVRQRGHVRDHGDAHGSDRRAAQRDRGGRAAVGLPRHVAPGRPCRHHRRAAGVGRRAHEERRRRDSAR